MCMEIQPQWEEFIIAIFKMNRRQGKATNKELSQWLSVSPSLVTELIKKMQTEGILAPGKNIIAHGRGGSRGQAYHLKTPLVGILSHRNAELQLEGRPRTGKRPPERHERRAL